MEPSTELLQLLREIRDAQRESLAMTKAWKERSDRQYREWEEQQAKDMLQWREANKCYIEQSENWRLQQRVGRRIGVAILAIMLLGAITFGILAAMGLLK